MTGANLMPLSCEGADEVEVAAVGAVRVADEENDVGIEGFAFSAAKEEVVYGFIGGSVSYRGSVGGVVDFCC